MNIKPILFSTEMVKAILEGRKTQTRRIIKPQPKEGIITTAFDFKKGFYASKIKIEENPDRFEITKLFKPKYQTGDILWVRETWQTAWNIIKKIWETIYKADDNLWFDDDGMMIWKPSIYMPKEAARIFLQVTNVRVERLKDISEEDAIAEGVEIIHYAEPILPVFRKYNLKEKKGTLNPILSFQTLWEKINGEDSWKANPWVWVYEFKQVDKPKHFTNEH